MKINKSKWKVVIFTPHRKYAYMPRLTLSGEGGENLDVVESVKLLGVKLRSDMRWSDNTDYICKKGYSRLWILRRLKGLGATKEELLDVYQKQVRSILELAVPVWQSGITKQERNQIERVQECALSIILGDQYFHYKQALELLDCENLEVRRLKICENFVKKAVKNPKFKHWFRKYGDTASKIRKRKVKNQKYNASLHIPYRTDRYRDSPLPFMTEILNRI